MSGVSRETDLAGPVAEWLESLGCTVYAEVPLMYGMRADLVGDGGGGRLIAVELKLTCSETLRIQCLRMQTFANEVWGVVATKPRCPIGYGVGTARVVDGGVRVIEHPKVDHPRRPTNTAGLLRAIRGRKPSRSAGMACLPGVGPAQEVYDLVQAYRAANPKATWHDVWRNVPNHYCTPKSMQGGLRFVAERRALQRSKA